MWPPGRSGARFYFRLGDGSRGTVFDAGATPAPVVRLHYREEFPALQPEVQAFYLGLYLDSVPYSIAKNCVGWTTLAGV